MKALSLTQPYATAMALGVKIWETRSWPTHFRGFVAIHAAKNFPGWAKAVVREAKNYHSGFPDVEDMPLDCIVCVGEITECRRTDELRSELSTLEQRWGDYSEGRYAFKFELNRMIVPPVPAKGALGFWTMDEAMWGSIQNGLVK